MVAEERACYFALIVPSLAISNTFAIADPIRIAWIRILGSTGMVTWKMHVSMAMRYIALYFPPTNNGPADLATAKSALEAPCLADERGSVKPPRAFRTALEDLTRCGSMRLVLRRDRLF